MLANWITISRFPFLLLNILLLYSGTAIERLVGVALLFIGLMLDTVDGMVARKRGQTSLFGSVLDIAADRTYELVLWVCFTFCGLALAQAFAGFPSKPALASAAADMMTVFRITAWVAVVFCVFRGLPVIIHWMKEYWGKPAVRA